MEIVDHGYREFWCDDGSAPAESNIRLYMEKLSASLSAAGLNVDVSSKFFKELLLDAGFVDVKVVQEKVSDLMVFSISFFLTIDRCPSALGPKRRSTKRLVGSLRKARDLGLRLMDSRL